MRDKFVLDKHVLDRRFLYQTYIILFISYKVHECKRPFLRSLDTDKLFLLQNKENKSSYFLIVLFQLLQ